ncbi:uncharacterized protein LOC127277921 [Leptopilina boulardi]|uniref:uncharacterized protein LOC127277921 n=1 Tax=Leptopilina boulardi TaxID=63433 RepID=UPI0021F66C97|nr:uncharacterized protein LOC127277921 [Leptopilina boulardi]
MKEEQACEDYFKENTCRISNGQYQVKYAFNENNQKLGESRSISLRRFHFAEKQFIKNSELKSEYCEFIDKYKDLNHMSLTKGDKLGSGQFLPHHAVIKEDCMTTKNRVVFDGSAKTSTDDCLTGANSRKKDLFLRDDLSSLLKKGGSHLRKWASNDTTLIPESSQSNSDHMSLDPNSTIKTLEIHWDSRKDVIFNKIDTSRFLKTITKRTILSLIAKLFDPLGLLAPVIVMGKIIIQLLWKAGILWDSSVSASIHTMWLSFRNQLHLIEKITFDRFILNSNSVEIQLHGFCDASESAFGACIYLRSTDASRKIDISLVCAKSRVAPVKPVTLPRLELCGAFLLSGLYNITLLSLKLKIDKVYLWSDSIITLHWIHSEPHLLKTFVSNRIAAIQNLSTNCQWRHVPTKDNPADLVS